MFIAGLAVFTVALALCALSPTIALLIAARALQGIGSGIAVPLALALIIDATPPAMRGSALGAWGRDHRGRCRGWSARRWCHRRGSGLAVGLLAQCPSWDTAYANTP
jgi:sugar phosphate permease